MIDEPADSPPSRRASRRSAQGRILLVVDDEDRENEGDLVMAADKVTPEAVNFMAKHGRGLICVPHARRAPRRAEDLA